jgi:hypothetical protein
VKKVPRSNRAQVGKERLRIQHLVLLLTSILSVLLDPLSLPMQNTPLDMDCTDMKPFQYETEILQIAKMGLPQILAGEDERYLHDLVTHRHYHQGHNCSEGIRPIPVVEQQNIEWALFQKEEEGVQILDLAGRDGATRLWKAESVLLVCVHE